MYDMWYDVIRNRDKKKERYWMGVEGYEMIIYYHSFVLLDRVWF